QLASSEVFLYYQLGNFMDRFFANAVLLYTKNYDYYSTNTVIRQDFTEENKILIGGEQNFSAHAQGDYFFDLISSDPKLNLQYNQHESKNRVNGGGLRSVLYRMLEYGPTFTTGFSGIFNFSTGMKWKYNQVTTENHRNSFVDTQFFWNSTFRFSDRFNAKLKFELFHFEKIKPHQNYGFIDLDVRYELIKDTLSDGCDVSNLLNESEYRTYRITDFSVEIALYRLLPRQLLLSLTYTFR